MRSLLENGSRNLLSNPWHCQAGKALLGGGEVFQGKEKQVVTWNELNCGIKTSRVFDTCYLHSAPINYSCSMGICLREIVDSWKLADQSP